MAVFPRPMPVRLWGSQIVAFVLGSIAQYHTGSGVTWCFLRIPAIGWPAAPVSMRERQHRLSHGSYGRLRMAEELNEPGLRVGHPLPGSACLHAQEGQNGPFDATKRDLRGQNP